MKRLAEVPLREVDEPQGGAEVGLEIGDPGSPYLNSREAMRYLRFTNIRAFYGWLERNPIPTCHRGRTLMFERRVLDAVLRGELWTKRRRNQAVPR